MLTIHKYPVLLSPKFSLDLPINAEILSAQKQGDGFKLWAMVTKDNEETQRRNFVIYATGENIERDDNLKYIATLQQDSYIGTYVWHLFEVYDNPSKVD